MSFVNDATKHPEALTRSQAERFVLALAPFAPHVAEELWQRMGHADTIARGPWPEPDERYLVEDEFELVVQVLGKLRARVKASRSSSEDDLASIARSAVPDWLDGKEIVKTVVVPGRLVNFVVR